MEFKFYCLSMIKNLARRVKRRLRPPTPSQTERTPPRSASAPSSPARFTLQSPNEGPYDTSQLTPVSPEYAPGKAQSGDPATVPPTPTTPNLQMDNLPKISDLDWKTIQLIKSVEKAKKSLSNIEQAEFSTDDTESLGRVMQDAKDACRLMEQKRWSYRLNGQTIFVRDRIARTLETLQEYAKVGDIFVQHNPEVTALVWGGFRFLLQAANDTVKIREALFNALEGAVRRVTLCELYATVYEAHVTRSSGHDLDIGVFGDALSDFYAEVLIFFARTKLYLKSSERWQNPFPNHLESLSKIVDKSESALQTCAPVATILRVRRDSARFRSIEAFLGELPAKTNDAHRDISPLSVSEKRKLHECLLWLDQEDSSVEYTRNRDARAEGTCDWIFDDNEFQAWINSPEDYHLWVKGEAGTGKSVLSATILQRYQPPENSLSADSQQLILYFFFRGGSKRTSSTAVMVASLIDQLLQAGINVKRLLGIVEAEYDKKYARRYRSANTLWRMFLKMLQDYPIRVFVILDALDECADRKSVLSHMTAAADVGARFLVIGRPEADIVGSFEGSSNLAVIEMDAQRDIETFINSRINDSPGLADHRAIISSKVRDTSAGNFHCAALMLEELNALADDRTIDEVLEAMPSGLDEIYDRLIRRLPLKLAKLREITLLFVAFALRPVTVTEVAHAYAVKPGEEDLDLLEKRPRTAADISTACGTLVEISGTETPRFSHLTGKDYIIRNPEVILNTGTSSRISPRPNFQDATIALHNEIALITVSQMLTEAVQTNIPVNEDASGLSYAATCWPFHAEIVAAASIGNGASELWTKAKTLLWSDDIFRRWTEVIPPTDCLLHKTCLYWCDPMEKSKIDPLHVIATFGLSQLVEESLLAPRDINAQDYHGHTPLSWAARRGHEAVVKLLLEWPDLKINLADESARTPLSWASGNGHDAAVKLLLEQSDIDINMADECARTPLMWAAANGCDTVAKLLLERPDLDTNLADDCGQTPLLYAAANGRDAVVKLLLERHDLDVNLADGCSQTPLSWAAEYGRNAVVKLLLERPNIDINSADKYGQTPLSRATQGGHRAVVKMLGGLDPNTKFGE